MAESGQEKTEDATLRRRQEARKKGTVARSIDLTNSLTVLALIMVVPGAVSMMGHGFINGVRGALVEIPTEASFASIGQSVARAAGPMLPGLAILAVTAMIVGASVGLAQVGLAISAEPLKPSFGKINPLNGFKRLFSRSALFDSGKAIVKTFLFSYLVYSSLSANWPVLANLAQVTPAIGLAIVGSLARDILMKIAGAWLALAALDYFFQRKEIDKQLKMTKEEVKQEFKEAETSPELKMAMAARRRKLSKTRVADAVRNADVIITNPTHFSIALKYDTKNMHAPQVVAKGQDFLAARIRELAKEHRIPIVPNPPLARALYKKCEIGDYVPRELFQAVAEVLAFVYKTLNRKPN